MRFNTLGVVYIEISVYFEGNLVKISGDFILSQFIRKVYLSCLFSSFLSKKVCKHETTLVLVSIFSSSSGNGKRIYKYF